MPRTAFALALVASGAFAVPAALAAAPTCVTPAAPDRFEPPCNPFVASTMWSSPHRNSYAQASTPAPGPRAGDAITKQRIGGIPGMTGMLFFTEKYADGGRNVWGSVQFFVDLGNVVKLDAATGRVIDSYGFKNEFRVRGKGGVSNAYTVLDSDNRLIVGRGRAIDIYGDVQPGNRFSKIKRLRTVPIPARALCGPTDSLVGMVMMYDGRIGFATQLGVVGTIAREPDRMGDATLSVLSLNGDRCATASTADKTLEQVSNSVAADENGGIYVVTSKAQYRVNWDGTGLKLGWRAEYQAGSGASGVRIGDGSGSTPTVMGGGPGTDKFVVITDGAKLMNLVLFWRDEVPADWKGLPGKDRRIACEVPVTFGNPAATATQNEQSVLVRGYGSMVVNNELRNAGFIDRFTKPGVPRFVTSALLSGLPRLAPFGAERIDWDPATRTCKTTWANRTVSIPNGIPSMSTESGLVYGIGARKGVWGLEGLDWATGASKLWAAYGSAFTHNSLFAATTIGPDRTVWTGTPFGVDVYRAETQ